MTENVPVAAEPTVAEKRDLLRKDGRVEVGSRGKLSAEAEARYAELVAEGRSAV